MIPIIYDKNETAFTTMGLGLLPDCVICEVTEELNGEFDLELRYPRNGRRFELIDVDRILLVKPNDVDEPQPFRIYKIQKSIGNTITVFARHISYDLLKLTARPHLSSAMNLSTFNLWCRRNCFPAGKNIFTMTEDSLFYEEGTQNEIQIPIEFMKTPFVIRSTIGKIIKLFGAEMQWDGLEVKFLHRRGEADSGIVVEYGKNLVSLEADFDYSETADGIIPYYVKQDGSIIMDDVDGHPGIISTLQYPQTAIPVDFTQQANEYFQQHGWGRGDIRDINIRRVIVTFAAKEIIDKNPMLPQNGIALDFVDISKITGQKKIGLGDSVTVRYQQIGIDQTLRVVKTAYNCLLERYNNIDLGEVKKDVAQLAHDVDSDSTNIASGGFSGGSFIDGTEVKSPTISGDSEIHGAMQVYGDNGAYFGGYVGAAYGSSGDEQTTGVALSYVNPGNITEQTTGNYIIVTNAGVRLHAGHNNLYLTAAGAFLNGKLIAVVDDEEE